MCDVIGKFKFGHVICIYYECFEESSNVQHNIFESVRYSNSIYNVLINYNMIRPGQQSRW